MNEEKAKKINNDSDELTLCSMFHDFYNRKMTPIILFIWLWAIVFLAGMVYSGYEFVRAEETKNQIMYAAIFILFMQCVFMMKIFAWQMIHRNAINRHIRRLEQRVAELSETVKSK